tara:strand:- start:253 stop:2082 length:1830 start_codon:yes stop_codon:yes gene_type:complete
MKKICLSIWMIIFTSSVFAQQNSNLTLRKSNSQFNNIETKFRSMSHSNHKAPPLIDETFSSTNFPPTGWTKIDYASTSSDQNWHLEQNGDPGGCASVLYVNSVDLHDEWLISPLVTLDTVNYRLYFDFNTSIYWHVDPNDNADITVKVSTDGGTTWSNPLWQEDYDTISSGDLAWEQFEWHTSMVDLTSYSGQSINIAFHYYGTDGAQFNLDNILLKETPKHELQLKEAVFGGWNIGFAATTGVGYDYTFNPMNQATANPYVFEGITSNTGLDTQTNMVVHASVFEDATQSNVFSATSIPVSLPPMQNDTSMVTGSFAPANIGMYYIDIWTDSDSTVTDTANLATIVTDSIYGRDFSQDAGSWRVSRPCGGMVIGVDFDIYVTDTLTSVSAYVSGGSTPGAIMFGAIYEQSGDQQLPVFIAQTDDYTIKAADTNNWVTIPFDEGVELNAGTAYMITIGGYAAPIDTFNISVSGEAQAGCYIQDNGCDICSDPPCTYGYWYSISDVPMIRMNLGTPWTLPLSIDETVFEEKFEVYPNPNNGIFTVELNNIKADDYRILVTNVLGQEVYISNKEVSTLISEKIDLSDLSKGVYMLEVSNSESTITEKIIVE